MFVWFVWSTGGDFLGPLAPTCTYPELRYYLAELESSGFVFSKNYSGIRTEGEHGQLAEHTGSILIINNSTGMVSVIFIESMSTMNLYTNQNMPALCTVIIFT